uniref:Uncharacterized protein At2g02670 n=1 Tax=Arabidopsis thaliana TaxID=3702 RepID=O64710_ARATH|nr:hypothetical protein [Arabidopsis thaliana]
MPGISTMNNTSHFVSEMRQIAHIGVNHEIDEVEIILHLLNEISSYTKNMHLLLVKSSINCIHIHLNKKLQMWKTYSPVMLVIAEVLVSAMSLPTRIVTTRIPSTL